MADLSVDAKVLTRRGPTSTGKESYFVLQDLGQQGLRGTIFTSPDVSALAITIVGSNGNGNGRSRAKK